MLNAAMMLAAAGREVAYVGEAGSDIAGDIIVGRLQAAGVDTDCIDRFPDGATTVDLIFQGGAPDGIFYTKKPKENLVVKWPRIAPGDIVVFGNWFALAPRTKDAVAELVGHAASRGATLVYLPGFAPQLEPAITHVMPQILDYLENADMVVTFNTDYTTLFGSKTAAECFSKKIDFYTHTMVNIDVGKGCVDLFSSDYQHAATIDTPAPASALLADVLNHLAADSVLSSKQLPAAIKTWKAGH